MAHTLEEWSLRYGDFPNLTIAAPDHDICEMIYRDREETDEYAYLIAAVPDLLAACELAANRPAEVQAMMRRERFVIDNLEDRWQKFAFTLYTMLVGNATQAQAAIDKAEAKAD